MNIQEAMAYLNHKANISQGDSRKDYRQIAEWLAELVLLRAEVVKVMEAQSSLREFADGCIECFMAGAPVSMSRLEMLGLKTGLLEVVTVHEPCGDCFHCRCCKKATTTQFEEGFPCVSKSKEV